MWNDSVVTDGGMTILSQWAGGGSTLDITAAKLGGSTVPAVQLVRQTNVTGYKGNADIIQHKDIDGGVQFTIRISQLDTAAVIKQIGIFGKLNGGEEKLIAIYQDNDGISVPGSEMPEFAYDFNATIAADRGSDINVNVDPMAFVTKAEVADLPDIRYAVASRVNPNLLDNWYFKKPVCHRGLTEFAGVGYFVDRWLFNTKYAHTHDWLSVVLHDEDGGWGYFEQIVRIAESGKYTVAIWTNRGLFSAAFDLGDYREESVYYTSDMTVIIGFGQESNKPTGAQTIRFKFLGTSGIIVRACKLEFGTQQTLAHQENGQWVLNEIPNYAEEYNKLTFTKDDGTPSLPDSIYGGSSAWNSGKSYAVNDYCIYENRLWKCKLSHIGVTPSEGTYWTQVSLKQIDYFNSFVKRTSIALTNKSFGAELLRCGNIVMINSPHDFNYLQSGTNAVGAIPIGYRPIFDVTAHISNVIENIRATFWPEGVINIYSPRDIDQAFNGNFSAMWFTSDSMPT